MSPKLFATVVAIGGGCIGAPLLLWKESKSTSETPSVKQTPINTPVSSPDSPTQKVKAETDRSRVTKDLPTANSAQVGRGNCMIQRMSDDSVDFLANKAKENELYVELLCDKGNLVSGTYPWPDVWTGLFPERLFKDSFILEVNKNFNIKIKSESEKVNFQSNEFKSSFDGFQKGSLQNRKGSSLTVISVPRAEEQELKIYVLPE